MRRVDLTFSALHVPLDFLALLAAGITAYALRFSKFFTDIRPIFTEINFTQYLTSITFFAIIWLLIFAFAGLYSLRSRPIWNELGRIIIASTAGIMVLIATVFFQRELTTSRFIVLALWGLTILYVWMSRIILRLFRHLLLRARIGHEHIVIVGKGKVAEDLGSLYKTRPTLGHTVVRTVAVWSASAEKELVALVEKDKIQGLVLADPDISKEKALEIIAFAEREHITFRYLADPFTATFSHVEISAEGGIPVIEVKRTPLDGWGRIAKRAFDIFFSGLLLIIFSPILLVTAVLIKCESPGRIFFSRLPDGGKTQRIGQSGKPFHYFKFRSMKEGMHFMRYDALAHLDVRQGPLVKLKDDPRVTRIGKFIRKWSIDELPELILVFLGRMSLVGPRPHLPEEVAKYKQHHRRVLTLKPGITGMAQISGRSDLNFEDEVRLDTWYIEHWSPWLDLAILLKTPWAVISHRGVEENV